MAGGWRHPFRPEAGPRRAGVTRHRGDLIIYEWTTRNGVVEAPGSADEDTSGGFDHGGWHLPYSVDASRRGRFVRQCSAELFGESDDDAFGSADVTEPIAVLVLRQLANEFAA
jgi:hypothetical protein